MAGFNRFPNFLTAALLFLSAAAVKATPLDYFSIGGSAEVSQNAIDFFPRLVGPSVNGTGRFAITDASGLFAPLAPDFSSFPPDIETGTIVDRTTPSQQAGVDIYIANWITFNNPAFDYALDLTFVEPGNYTDTLCRVPAATGQTCTPAAPAPFVSPYNLSNFRDARGRLSSNANFSVRGIVRNTVTNTTVATFNGVLGAEFLGQSYQQVLAQIAANNGTGTVTASYSGFFEVVPVPEPGSWSMILTGMTLVGLTTVVRRRLQR